LFLEIGGGLNEPGDHLWIGSRLCHFEKGDGGLPRVEAILGHGYSGLAFHRINEGTLISFRRKASRHGPRSPVPVEVRPQVGPALAADLADETMLYVGQPDIIGHRR
jgi:hypothetical protein